MSHGAARIFECVPNVSDGRDLDLLDACARAIVASGARLAHRTSDTIHHRSVFTMFGSDDAVAAAVLALARVTTARIDLRVHRGAHPRIGALDVVPVIPFGSATMDDAVALARRIAREIWDAVAVPSIFYGEAATVPERRLLANVRSTRGAHPDIGEGGPHASAGTIAIGAREPLVAFNIVLATGDLALAKSIAALIRERDGGLRSLRALGIALGADRTQVSCNLTDVRATPLDRVVGVVRELARRSGVSIERTEVIGLVPRAALEDVARRVHAIEVPPLAAQ